MAQYPIDDFVNPKILTDLLKLRDSVQGSTKDLLAFLEAQKKMKDEFEDVGNDTNDTGRKMNEYTKLVNKAAESHNKLVQTAKALDNQQKQLAQTEAKLATAHTATNQKLVEQKIKLQETNKAIRDKIKTADAEEGSLVRMRQKLAQLTAEYDKSGTRTKAAAKEIGQLSKEIEIAENETNRFQRGVGGYRHQLGELKTSVINGTTSFAQMKSGIIGVGKAAMAFLLSPVGLVIGLIGGLVLAGKALIQNAQGFEKAASSLSAITGQVGEDLDFMKDKAIEFSKSSQSSAVDILGAFEKVGSAMPALLKNGALLTEVTKNAIALSEATGGKLSVEDAAKAAAGAMNQFNIPLTESARAINVLAAGSLEGSADINSISESLKNVGAVADGADLSLEQTVALLEVLGEKSIFGAEAGTKLRGSILKLQAAGVGYASGQFNMRDALEEVNQKMSEQGSAMERDAYAQKLFGAENITVGKILLNNVENYDRLTEAVTGTNTAFDQQRIQNDNLEGSYARLSNLWKAFMLGFEDGSGLIARVWKGLVDFTAAFIDGMIQWQQAFERFFSLFESRKKKAEKAARQEEKDRLAAIEAEKLAADAAAKAKEEADQAEAERLAMIAKLEEEKLEDEKKAADEAKKLRDKAEKEAKDRHTNALNRAKQQVEAEQASRKVFEDLAKKEKALDDSLMDEKFEDFEDEKEKEAMLGEMIKKNIIDNNIAYTRQRMLIDATSKTEHERAERIFNLDKEVLNSAITANEQLLNSSTLSAVRRVEIEGQIAQQRVDLEQMVFDKEMENNEKRKEAQEQLKESILATTNAIFDFRAERISQDLELLEQANARGELSDTEYAKKKAELEIKAAKNKKIAGLFDVGIDTAKSVAKIWADVPKGDFGIMTAILTGLAIANGAMQAATIASAPLPAMPAFAKGTDNAPRRGLFGESGAELMLTQSGAVYYADKPTYFDGNEFKGAKIWSGAETAEIMNRTKTPQFGSSSRTDNLLLMEIKGMRKDMKRQKSPIFGEGNKPIGFEQNGSTTKIINFYKYGR